VVPERRFSASLVIAKSPWDVYDFLADEGQQAQWRPRHAPEIAIAQADPYTRILYANNLEFRIEPDGSNTLLTLERGYESKSGLGLRLFGKKAQESELLDTLKRVEASLLYDAI
jgi:hypothetical protein